MHHELTDKQILERLKTDEEEAVNLLFKKYYVFLTRVIYRVIPDKNLAEDIAQDVFLEVWRKRERLNINISLKAYLRRAAINKSLNFIRDRKVKWEDEERIPVLESKMISAIKVLETNELQDKIDAAIDALPNRCRLVFTLSRFEGLTYQQIADKLEISIKTVENQMSKALKLLRVALKDYL